MGTAIHNRVILTVLWMAVDLWNLKRTGLWILWMVWNVAAVRRKSVHLDFLAELKGQAEGPGLWIRVREVDRDTADGFSGRGPDVYHSMAHG